MKRSPLRRRTPLRSRTPLAKVGRKARREASALDAFRRACRERSEGLCEVGWWPVCERWGSMAHHRAPSDRDRGIHDPARGLWTCGPCHDHIHRNPAVAYERGWLIRSEDA